MTTTATQTYQQGVQNLQGWLDFLAAEEEKLQAQLTKMQGGEASLPEIEADAPEPISALPEEILEESDSEEKLPKWS